MTGCVGVEGRERCQVGLLQVKKGGMKNGLGRVKCLVRSVTWWETAKWNVLMTVVEDWMELEDEEEWRNLES